MSRRLTYISVLVAMSLILKMLGNIFMIGGFKVSFVYISWIVAGVILGPIGGCAVSFITDILGTFIMGGLTIQPLMVLGNTLYPLFPAIAFRLPGKYMYLKIVVGSCVSLFVCTLGFNTLSLAQYYGIPYLAYFVTRLAQVPVFVFNIFAIGLLMPVVRRYLFMPAEKNKTTD